MADGKYAADLRAAIELLQTFGPAPADMPDDEALKLLEIIPFDDESDDRGVMQLFHGRLLPMVENEPERVDALWWRLVVEDAIENEHEYGLDTTKADVLVDGEQSYDEAKVAAWLTTQLEQPRWRWYAFREVAEYGDQELLTRGAWDDPDSFFGAVVSWKKDRG